MPRGRAARPDAQEQATYIEELLALSAKGSRFTRRELDKWNTLITHIDGARKYLMAEDAEFLTCVLTTRLGGFTFEATFDGKEWKVKRL